MEIQAEFRPQEGGNTGPVQVLGRWIYRPSLSPRKAEVQVGFRAEESGSTGQVKVLGRWKYRPGSRPRKVGLSWVKSNAKQYGTFDEVAGGVVLAECGSSAVWRNTRRPSSGRFVVGCGNDTDTKSCYT